MSTQVWKLHRASDPVTSRMAAESVDLARSHGLVMAAATGHLRGGFTGEQMAAHLAGVVSPSRARSAIRELVRDGLLVETGRRERTVSGRWAMVIAPAPGVSVKEVAA